MARVSFTSMVNVLPPVVIGDVPPLGAAKLIAPAGAHLDKCPSGLTTTQFQYSAFGSYGSGAFNPGYSADGAFIVCDSGGHLHPPLLGALGFDFTTRQWFYTAAAGMTERGTDYAPSETNGSPWYEIAGTEVPSPGHLYRTLSYIPPARGGGSKGSMITVGRAAITGNIYNSGAAHKFDLATGTWRRAAALVGGTIIVEASTVFDPVTGRYYKIPTETHDKRTIQYLDSSDWTFKSTPQFAYSSGSTGYGSAVLVELDGKRLILQHWGTVFKAFDVDAPTAGWRNLAYTGTRPANTANAMVFHAAQGALYWRGRAAQGQTLTKLTPPATNVLTGTWTYSTVTLAGDTVPEYAASSVSTEHYQSLFYIPSLQMLGWVTANGVALLNP